jgi:serine/threonine protein kinase
MDLPFSTETSEPIIYTDRSSIPYSVEGVLGSGTYGTVYKVRCTQGRRAGTIYALKSITLRQNITSRGNALQRAQNEVQLIRQARHIHVITLVETYKCKRECGIVMEPVAEGTLGHYLKYADQCDGAVFSAYRSQLFKWFGCLASALAFLHRRNIRHRDIKPSNILVQGRNLLFTDFGISFEDADITEQDDTDVCGTAKYRAPSPDQGLRFGRPADVFALGAVFLEMVTVCCGQDNLSDFNDVINGPYSSNLEIVHNWIDNIQWRLHQYEDELELLRSTRPPKEALGNGDQDTGLESEHDLANSTAWTLSMLFLIRNMLEPSRRYAPTAIAIAMGWAYAPLTGLPPNECNCQPDLPLIPNTTPSERTFFVFSDSLSNQNFWAFALAAKHVGQGDVLRWTCCRCGLENGQAAFGVEFNFPVREALSCPREGCGYFICESCPRDCMGMPEPQYPKRPTQSPELQTTLPTRGVDMNRAAGPSSSFV